jgi:membrane-associated phospholipid phosphatase
MSIDTAVSDTTRRTPFVICHRVPAREAFVVIAAMAAVVLASSIVAWGGDVPSWEREVLLFVNGWPDFLEPVFWVLQQVGVILAPVIGGLIVVAFTRQWQHLIPFVLVLPLKMGIEKGLVKNVVERNRPFQSIGPEVHVRGPAFEGLSFPSGHATTAFALGILLTAFLPPKWRAIPVVWAFIVAIARMYYGEHNLLDVVAGAAMGTAFATVLWFFFLNKFAHPDCRCAEPS